MMENAHFQEMIRVCRNHAEKKKEHDAKKRQIIQKYGFESKELSDWYDEFEAMVFPYSSGEMKAFWAWRNSQEFSLDFIEMEDHLWENEVADFVKTLKQAGIGGFVFSNRSTGLMENIHQLIAEGCTLVGPSSFVKKTKWDEERPVIGLEFRI